MKKQICYRCRRHLDIKDNAVVIHLLAVGSDPSIPKKPALMHLLPIKTWWGKVVCRGSPSRAQYIEGQKRDTRDGFRYNPTDEPRWRQAYELLQTGTLEEAVKTMAPIQGRTPEELMNLINNALGTTTPLK